jgi:hypothetical protein
MADQDPTIPRSAITYGNSVFTDRNAFYNYDKTTPAQEKETIAKQNPPFKFPGNTYRDIANNTQIMRRGFMRSILFDDKIFKKYYDAARTGENNNGNSSAKYVGTGFSGNAPGNRKLNFQFNPDYLERSVSQSVGSMNPLLQNPAQLRQSVPGTAKFGFSMTFNREMEVAAGGFKRKQLQYDYNKFQDDYANFSKTPDPEVLGVLADLMIFDTIIGQGISPDIVEAISLFTERSVVQQQKYEQEQLDDYKKNNPDGTELPQTSTNDFNVNTLLENVNFGNSAFLNPLPVRIVFSDYFMVEGVITASNVGFQKFSKDLIPTVCQVNVSVDALYIGFAQRNAYLTKQLEDSASQAQDQADADTAEIETIKQKLDAKIGRIDTNYNRLLSYGIDGINLQTLGDSAAVHSQVPASSSNLWKYQWDSATNYGGYSSTVPLEMWYNQKFVYNDYGGDLKKYNWSDDLPFSATCFFATTIDLGLDGIDEKDIRVVVQNPLFYFKYIKPDRTTVNYSIACSITETEKLVGKVAGITDVTVPDPNNPTPTPRTLIPLYQNAYGFNYLINIDPNKKLPDLGYAKQTLMNGGSQLTLLESGLSVDFYFEVDITTKATGTPTTVKSNVKKITKHLQWGEKFFHTFLISEYIGLSKKIGPGTPPGQYT